MTVAVRPAVEDDLAAIAEIRVRSWQAAYRGIVPQGYLDSMRPEADADRRRARLAARLDSRRDAVGTVAGAPVEWVALGPYRDDDDDPPGRRPGEVYAIYVHPDHWGRGVGQALIRYAVRELRAVGMAPVLLWALEENARARRFYQRAGFRPDGARHLFEIAGVQLPELRYRHGRGRLRPPGDRRRRPP